MACILFAVGRANGADVEYYRDIAPIFAKNCVACHNLKKPEGGLNLESVEALMQGGDSGRSIEERNPEESYLLWRVNGEEEPLMPPADNAVGAKKLSAAELKLLSTWIATGMPLGEPVDSNGLQWKDLPDSLKPVYSIEQSDDGSFLAFGYGQDVMVLSHQESAADQSQPGRLQTLKAGAKDLHSDHTHLDIVQSIAISPDCTRIATGGYRNVKIWKRDNDARLLLDEKLIEVTTAAIAPRPNLLVVGNCNGELVWMDVKDAQRPVRRVKVHTTEVVALAALANNRVLSTDAKGHWAITTAGGRTTGLLNPENVIARQLVAFGKAIFCLDRNGQLRTVRTDPNTKQQMQVVTKRLDRFPSVLQIAGSPKKPCLVVSCADGAVHVFDTTHFRVVKTLQLGPSALAFAIDSTAQRLATLSDPIQVWDLESGEQVCVVDDFDLPTHQRIAFLERELKRLQSQRARNVNQVAALVKASEKEAEALKKLEEAVDKASDALKSQREVFETAKSNARQLKDTLQALKKDSEKAGSKQEEITAAEKKVADSEKLVNDASTAVSKAESELAERNQAYAAGKDSAERAASAITKAEQSGNETFDRLKDAAQELSDLRTPSKHPAHCIAFSADGSRLLVERGQEQMHVYSTASGESLLGLNRPFPIRRFSIGESTIGITELGLTELGITELGLTELGLTEEGHLLTWNIETPWKLDHSIGKAEDSPFSDRITALDFSPDNSALAVGSGPPSRSGEVVIVNVNLGAIEKDLGPVHSDTVLGLRYDPSGRTLATVAADKLCKTFEVETGQYLQSLEGHTHHVLAVDWREDGEVLATAAADASVKVWNAETGEQIRTIGGFGKEVSDLHFVGDTHNLICGSADGSVRMFDADSGKQTKSFAGTRDAVFGLAISPKGELVSAGGQAGLVWTWQINDAKLLSALPKRDTQ